MILTSLLCRFDGCEDSKYARGWCKKHYNRWWTHGDPSIRLPTGAPPPPLVPRFWQKVDVQGPEECWVWLGATTALGYGQFRDGRTRKAHRIAWEITRGPIVDGLSMLHTCDNPPCVNPMHLWLGTQKDNAQDMARKGRQWKQRQKAVANDSPPVR